MEAAYAAPADGRNWRFLIRDSPNRPPAVQFPKSRRAGSGRPTAIWGVQRGYLKPRARRAKDKVINIVHEQLVQQFVQCLHEGDLIVTYTLGHVHLKSTHAAAAEHDQLFGASGEAPQSWQPLQPVNRPAAGVRGTGDVFCPLRDVQGKVLQDTEVKQGQVQTFLPPQPLDVAAQLLIVGGARTRC